MLRQQVGTCSNVVSIVPIYFVASGFPSDNVQYEGRVSSSIAHVDPQEERLKRYNNMFQEKMADCDISVERHTTTTAYNSKERTTDNPPFYPRSEQDNNDTTDFSIPTRVSFVASKHRSPHSVRVLGLGFGSGGQSLL